MMEKFQDFMGKFQFNPERAGLVGVERESFLVNGNGKIAPIAPKVLAMLTNRERFGYELSACQLEDRIGPCELWAVRKNLSDNDKEICLAGSRLHFKRLHTEVAPADMPLDVFPDPTGRYQDIVRNMPTDILLSACRIIGTHVHIGMPNYDVAIQVYNQVISQLDYLCCEGDCSDGERLRIYRKMAPDQTLRPYRDWHDFHAQALEGGFADDPRKNWDLIRISAHGTIEFRMFGTTDNLDRVEGWVNICHNLCAQAMGL